MGDSGELSYIVKVTGKVQEVTTLSQAVYMSVKIVVYIGTDNVRIQIWPVYKASSIRDTLSFIKFGDYKNQGEWAAVSQSINEIVAKDVVEPVNPSSLEGKSISFVGAFTVSSGSSDVLITPAVLEVK